MAALLEPRLVNGPAGDSALFVDLVGRKRALLFDLGRCDALAPAEMLRITDIFVTHTHIDHFIGFDTVVRWHLARTTHLRVYGPPPLLTNVAGRLQGYTWNLVTESSPIIDVVELGEDGTPARTQRFVCAQRFAPGPVTPVTAAHVRHEPEFTVRSVLCDHHDAVSAAWRLDTPTRWHVVPEALEAAGLTPGPWVSVVKEAAAGGVADDTPLATPTGPRPLGEFVELGILRSAPGTSLAYVTDVAWTDANRARLLGLCADVDVLYCEGGFLEADAAHARAVSHLTAANAGALAREAGARELRTFHFSRRYHPDFDPLRDEAAAAFRGQPQ